MLCPLATARAVTLRLVPDAVGRFLDDEVDGVFDELRGPSPFLQTTKFDQGVNDVETRVVLEYDLASAPLDRRLLSARFVATIGGTQTPAGFTELSMDLLGYAGDGQITFSDITATTTPIGVFTIPIPASGVPVRYSADLDVGYVAAEIASGTHLGLMTRKELDTGSITIRGVGGAGFFANTDPVLVLAFVPEPSSALIAAVGAVACGCWGARRRGRIGRSNQRPFPRPLRR